MTVQQLDEFTILLHFQQAFVLNSSPDKTVEIFCQNERCTCLKMSHLKKDMIDGFMIQFYVS